MSGRTISNRMRAALYDRETDEVALALLTFTHDDLQEDIRLCTAPVVRLSTDPLVHGVASNGKQYEFAPIDVMLPEDVADGDPRASLGLDNIDRSLVETIRSIEEGATVQLDIILADDPDTIEIQFPALVMAQAEYDRETIVVDLTIDTLGSEPYPGDTFNPTYFPGLT